MVCSLLLCLFVLVPNSLTRTLLLASTREEDSMATWVKFSANVCAEISPC